MVLTEKEYPKKLAFLYLEEIKNSFENFLQTQFDSEFLIIFNEMRCDDIKWLIYIYIRWMREVEIIGRPYGFIQFGI